MVLEFHIVKVQILFLGTQEIFQWQIYFYMTVYALLFYWFMIFIFLKYMYKRNKTLKNLLGCLDAAHSWRRVAIVNSIAFRAERLTGESCLEFPNLG